MLLSHMESKGQRWTDPNVRLGELGDVSSSVASGYNYGFSDIMMSNLWGYDFNMLDESQNGFVSGFPEQGLSAFAVSDVGLSSRFVMDDKQHNIENDDPNSIKLPKNNETEKIENKATQKCVKGTRSKRGKRTVFEGSWNFSSTPSMERYGSVDNQGSVMSKRASVNDVGEPVLKKRKGKKSSDNHGSVMSKRTMVNELSKRQKGGRNNENNEIISESVTVNSVARWLEDVGFGRYAAVFEMHEVDEEALPLLTLDDLKEMGVVAVGTRRKLYAAICGIKGQSEN